jgi:hypothetical protein
MSNTPPGIASNYAAMTTIRIPQHWSDEQALAVWDLLDEIARCVWDRYELPLIELLRPDLEEAQHDQPDLFDPDDEIPF